MTAKLNVNQSLLSPVHMLWNQKKKLSSSTPPVAHAASSLPSPSSEEQTNTPSSSNSTNSPVTSRECFKQNNLQNELNTINEQIAALSGLKATGLWRPENSKELNDLTNKRSKLKQALHRLKNNQAAQTRARKKSSFKI
ncbi:unnamed protein product, partial [Rotaria sp. Silwood2]